VASNHKGLRMDVFDGGIMDALSQLPPQALQIALSEISSSDFTTVRKPGGYIMGIIKRHRRS
jgi:Heterogeneous nuclear ribonucleoprotein Q acidic domain